MLPEIKIKKIYRSRRRTLALEITPLAELIVRAPYAIPEYKIFDFIDLKRAWILVKQKFVSERLGKRKARQLTAAEEILYRARAREIITERCEYFAQKMGLRYSAIRINGAKKRLGSCSAKNSLNFTWRLVLAPLRVIDYVVIHELCHIEVKNHSARFWNKVRDFCPSYREEKRWLKENASKLR
jgi:predicted metal-dependent hydrolase